jgi:TLD
MEWLGKEHTTELLYSATRDGFSASAFHTKCDNKGPTVVVIKSANGNLFGGYAAASWDQSGNYKNAPGSFLFVLSNASLTPTKYNCQETGNDMYCNAGYGPTFGGGHDLRIATNSNGAANSYSGFPNSYIDSTGLGNATFAGARAFMTSDIEVFQVK